MNPYLVIHPIEKNTFGQCRCCLANGYHKDLMKEYFSNGFREVYYDILAECFNIFLSSNQSLGTLICSSCITELKAANKFRNKVIDTEQQLLATIRDGDTVFVNVPTEPPENTACINVKLENDVKVKQEFEVDFEVDSADVDQAYGNDSPPPPPSTEVLVPGAKELISKYRNNLKRLPTRSMLATLYPEFVRQLEAVKDKMITPEMIEKHLVKVDTVKLSSNIVVLSEKYAVIHNASVIVESSNCIPFKSRNRTGFPCFYCRQTFENLKEIQEHQKANHKKKEFRSVLGTYGSEAMVVYVDVSDLECTICNEKIPNLIEFKSHLIKKHKKKIYTEYPDRVIPFKLSDDNVFECQNCGFSFETFGSIERHMNTHYRNYVCKDCGAGFITKYRLKVHVKSMHIEGNHPCELCKKVFSSQQKLKNHTDTVHKLIKRFKCPKCSERFTEYFQRQKHMVTAHGVAPLEYKCNVCDKAFNRRYTLSRHMKRDHLEERDFQCEICSYKCFTNNELRVHMIKHNGERIFECSVCKKSYARKKTLKEHMRIHNNDRRFACAVCGQAFVQKCSLKGHVKTHHAEYNMPL